MDKIPLTRFLIERKWRVIFTVPTLSCGTTLCIIALFKGTLLLHIIWAVLLSAGFFLGLAR